MLWLRKKQNKCKAVCTSKPGGIAPHIIEFGTSVVSCILQTLFMQRDLIKSSTESQNYYGHNEKISTIAAEVCIHWDHNQSFYRLNHVRTRK